MHQLGSPPHVPGPIRVAAIICWVEASWLILVALIIKGGGDDVGDAFHVERDIQPVFLVIGLVFVALGGLFVWLGLQIIKLKYWARPTMISFAVLGILISLGSLGNWNGLVGLAVNIAVAVLLCLPVSNAAFSASAEQRAL
jgi:hypothetical protein